MTTLKKQPRVYNHGSSFFRCITLSNDEHDDLVHLTNYDKIANTVCFHNVKNRKESKWDVPLEKAIKLAAQVVIDELKKA